MSYLIIGIGNPFRRDDGVGVKVAESLAAAQIPDCTIRVLSGEGAALMECWDGSDRVIVIDAARTGSNPGKIHELDAAREKIASDFFHYSSHAFGLAEAIEMSRALNQLPESIVVYGIEGADFSEGMGLSLAVETAAEITTARIREYLAGARQ